MSKMTWFKFHSEFRNDPKIKRIPVALKKQLDAIAKSEQRDRIVVVTRMLTEAIAASEVKG